MGKIMVFTASGRADGISSRLLHLAANIASVDGHTQRPQASP